MNILFVCPNAYMSGRFNQMIFAPRELAVQLVDGLVDQGHNVTFVTAADVKTKARIVGGDEAFLSLLAQSLSTPLSNGADRRIIDAIRRDYEIDLILKAAEECKKGLYDVVHVFQKDFTHFFDHLFAPVPTVYTIHDPVPEKGTLSALVYERFNTHRLVAISESQKNLYKGFNVIDRIYHAIDVSKYPFCPKPDNRAVFMGRMVPQKGLEDAIKASVVTNTKLLVASDWNDGSDFAHHLDDLLDIPMIETIGVVDQPRRAAMLGKGKVLLFPIKWEEPFGMVMIEAMACGTPVIAYGRGSVPELVKDGVTGFIVPPEEGVEGLIRAMKRIGEIDRKACREHVIKHFTFTQMVQGYEHVYQSILKS